MINNLHSLLSGKWFIEPSMINGFLPLFENVLSTGKIEASKQPEPFKVYGNHIVGYSFNDNKDKPGEKHVMVHPIKSTIFKYNQECGPRGTKYHQSVIQSYLNDPLCAGIVLDIDSGGGQVSGTPEFHDFLKSAEKPIHTYTDGYLCSAAYYIASGTKSITANPRTDKIGSIGTMISFLDLTGYYEKQGAKVITEYATKSTEKNRAFEDLLKGKPELYIKTELDPITDTFINDVKAVRKDVKESVFNGSTYNANEALAMGLIDKIGQLKDVVQSIFDSTKPQNSNNNSKSNMKMSNHLKVMAVIGVATLAIDESKGTYFNEEHLQSLENALTANETEKETLTASLQTANDAKATAEADLQTEKTAHATSLQNIASALGLPATANAEDINARISALKPAHTNPTGTEKPKEEGKGYFDPNASHNQMAANIHKY